MESLPEPAMEDIQRAADLIAPLVHRTPVFTCRSLDELSGARLFFKCENLQRTGAFKFRGASNAVFSLSQEQARRGVVTHSSGNHASALSLAASLRGIPAYIVMPDNAPLVKMEAVRRYGGQITFCRPTLESRQETADRLLRRTGGVLVHPYDDPAVIAGQGTVALELLEQVPDLQAIVVPVSGGGLISGIALAATCLRPDMEVIGAEPAQADDAARSFRTGRLVPASPADTIADGLRAALSPRTFSIVRRHVRDFVTVEEQAIVDAMRLIWDRMKLVVEPSAAVPLAGVLARSEAFHHRRVAIILSGGNVDLGRLPWQ